MATSRVAALIGTTLIVGILAGVAGTRAADTLPVKRTMLIQTPLVEKGSGELAGIYGSIPSSRSRFR